MLLKVNTAALIGRDGRMFYEGDEMVRQSAGLASAGTSAWRRRST